MNYRAYLRSPHWRQLRAERLKAAGYRCYECGASGVVLQLHHLTYARLGSERPGDLRVLCKVCHRRADRKRKTRR